MKQLFAAIIMAISALFLLSQPTLGYDEREIKMNLVLAKYHSPLAGQERLLIATAAKYNLDWTLLAAIAGTESSFGRRMPADCLNPYGWGIYGRNRLCFESFAAAITGVGEGIGTRYNTTSLASIAKTYNSANTADWIRHTRFFMKKIKDTEIPVSRLPIRL